MPIMPVRPAQQKPPDNDPKVRNSLSHGDISARAVGPSALVFGPYLGDFPFISRVPERVAMVDLFTSFQSLTAPPVMVRAAVSVPDFENSFWDLVDAAQTTHGLVVVGAVVVCAWLALRAFR